jgi:hypothetical protein
MAGDHREPPPSLRSRRPAPRRRFRHAQGRWDAAASRTTPTPAPSGSTTSPPANSSATTSCRASSARRTTARCTTTTSCRGSTVTSSSPPPYHGGTTVADVTDPVNPVEIGFYEAHDPHALTWSSYGTTASSTPTTSTAGSTCSRSTTRRWPARPRWTATTHRRRSGCSRRHHAMTGGPWASQRGGPRLPVPPLPRPGQWVRIRAYPRVVGLPGGDARSRAGPVRQQTPPSTHGTASPLQLSR